MSNRDERKARLQRLVKDKHAKEAEKLEREREYRVRRLPGTPLTYADYIKRRDWVVKEPGNCKPVQRVKRKLESEGEAERPKKRTKAVPSLGDRPMKTNVPQKKLLEEKVKANANTDGKKRKAEEEVTKAEPSKRAKVDAPAAGTGKAKARPILKTSGWFQSFQPAKPKPGVPLKTRDQPSIYENKAPAKAVKLKLTAPKPPPRASRPKLDFADKEDSASPDLTPSLGSSVDAKSTSKSSESPKSQRPEETLPPKEEKGKVRAKIAEATKTPKGLFNHGRNCFLSAAIQCVADDLAQEYRQLKDKVGDSTSVLGSKDAAIMAASRGKNTRKTAATKVKVQSAFAKIPKDQIFVGAYLGEVLEDLRGDTMSESHVSPFMLCQAYGYLKPGFEGSADQDPEQFLIELFDQLGEEHYTIAALAASKGEASQVTSEQAALVERLYQGTKGNKFECNDCGNTWERRKPFWILQIGLHQCKTAMTVADCVKGQLRKWDEDNVRCPKCKKMCSQFNTEWLEKAPRNLIMRLQRADIVEGKVQKIFTQVDLPREKIDLSVCGDGGIAGDQEGSSYELYAVVKHRGELLQTGHYLAYVKHGEQWWQFNDHQVREVTMDDVDNGDEEQPYLLFFRRP